MLDLTAWFLAGGAILAVVLTAWLYSIRIRDVSIVDGLWSLLFLVAALVYAFAADSTGPRAVIVLLMVAAWALRLSLHIVIRNHGEGEDRRYQAIRNNNQPNFKYKSLYIVFLLQGFLAWVICLPVFAAVSGQAPPGPLDIVGFGLWLAGLTWETVADYQLSRFRKTRQNQDQVLDTGLWRYSRHPNYFGEALLWWGIYLMALSAGHGWTVFAPLLMTFLLLKVSGVALLEKDIADRRPAYRDYVERTPAFIPWRPASGRKPLGVIALVLLLNLPNHSAPLRASEEVEPSKSWQFRVFLDDREIGYHHFYLAEAGGHRQLRSVASFEYRLLFVKLFHYEHENKETWSGDCLQTIQSTTDSNGEPFQVSGRLDGGAFAVEGSSGQAELPECVMSFAYWNPAFLDQPFLLNTQNGDFEPVDISPPVSEELEVRGELRPTFRYRLAAGALNLDLWYSTDREWLALESEVQGGRKLRYVLM